jgi:hypothetical protein
MKSLSFDLQFYLWNEEEIVWNKAGRVEGMACCSYFVLDHELLDRQDGVSRHSVVMNQPISISSFLRMFSAHISQRYHGTSI